MDILPTRYGMIAAYSEDDLISRSLKVYGEWAQNEISVMMQFIPIGGIIYDIGSYISTHALAFSRHVGDKGHVFCFEPQREAFVALQRTRDVNNISNWTINSYGLGSQDTLLDAHSATFDLHNLASYSLMSSTLSSYASEESDSVVISTLDSLPVNRCDFMKIDVEGMEVQVLLGGKQTIAKYNPIIFCECNFLENGLPIIDWCKENSYQIFGLASAAYNPSNFLVNTENFLGDAAEVMLILVSENRMTTYQSLLNEVGAIAINGPDKLASVMFEKPQYTAEVATKFDSQNNLLLNTPTVKPEGSEGGQQSGNTFHKPARSITVAVPFYKNPHLVRSVFKSLQACADELEALNTRIVFYNDSPDDLELKEELAQCSVAKGRLNLIIIENVQNLGFVKTINNAFQAAIRLGHDIVLLNSDTYLFPGVISELRDVAYQDPMIGFVSPRSNNATICSLPHESQDLNLTPEMGFQRYEKIAQCLTRFSYVPTAVGFCLFIKWNIIAELGGFDLVYEKGYNEENDLIMRAARYGYRCVLANHAFVWHEGEASFNTSEKSKPKREEQNRKILLSRYPEYSALVHQYMTSAEYQAEGLLSTLVSSNDKKLSIGFDYSSFGTYHNGTFEAGKKLLMAAARLWPKDISIIIFISKASWDFHQFGIIDGVEQADPDDFSVKTAAIVRMGQPFDINTLSRLYKRSPVVGIFMLDTIAADCSHLQLDFDQRIWQFSLNWSDIIFTISKYTNDQVMRRYHIGGSTMMLPNLCSISIDDYVPSSSIKEYATSGKKILVVGNQFVHKAMAPTVKSLADSFPNLEFLSFGGPDLKRSNVECIQSGDLSDPEIESLYTQSQAVIFPTHYEGFGFPLLHSLARSKPIYVRRIPVFKEIADRLQEGAQNIYWYDTTQELIDLLRLGVPGWQGGSAVGEPDGWGRSAMQVLATLQFRISKSNHSFISERLRWFSSFMQHNVQFKADIDRYNLVSRQISARIENILSAVLSNRAVYYSLRFVWRFVKRVRSFFERN